MVERKQLHEQVAELRRDLEKRGNPVPTQLQGVTKARIREVLSRLAMGDNKELVDGVFALLDDQTPSWFHRPPTGAKFCDGASTAHLACHIGILQRGGSKLDREGRDYWIKPLRNIGAIEPIFLHSESATFIPGHPVSKSPNSAYRLNAEFKKILQASETAFPAMLSEWSAEDSQRQRLEFQAKVADEAKHLVDRSHSDLIEACINHYVPHFLPGYAVIYVDDGDGDRITSEDRQRLASAGVDLALGDAMPDVLLWNSEKDALWVIEAVTSDGEVDEHKSQRLKEFASRFRKSDIGFTTAYQSWRDAAARQAAHKNIADGSYIWIHEDPSKHFRALGFSS